MNLKTSLPMFASMFAAAGTIATLCGNGACSRTSGAPHLIEGMNEAASITVTSPAFAEGKPIPVDNTCDGKDLMPELAFSAPPQAARSLAIIVDDPDAPGGTFTHMVLFDVSPDTRKLPSGASAGAGGPSARFGVNDFKQTRYSGPCPPHGQVHRYVFHVLASNTMLGLPEGASRARVEQALDGHVVGQGTLTGTFGH